MKDSERNVPIKPIYTKAKHKAEIENSSEFIKLKNFASLLNLKSKLEEMEQENENKLNNE